MQGSSTSANVRKSDNKEVEEDKVTSQQRIAGIGSSPANLGAGLQGDET